MFVHLHLHTEYSLLDGAARIKEAVATAKTFNMPALAITDHGSMFGIIDFYKACQKEKIKPILGCEVYVAPRTMRDRTPHIDDQLSHLILLAENETGYRNLLQLVSASFTGGFYYKPRVDKNILAKHHRGLIALSGCFAGEIPGLILKGDLEKAKKAALEYLDIFGAGNFYLELQDHGLPEQQIINKELVNLHRTLDIPLVATNDVHYVQREHAFIQDVLLCIQTGKSLSDPARLKFRSPELYLKSPSEMETVFQEVPSAIENTWHISQRCEVNLTFGQTLLPAYNVPPAFTADSYLKKLCREGIEWRYGIKTDSLADDRRPATGDQFLTSLLARLSSELKVIKKMGYATYFLIVWDFIHFARQNNIPVGPGRGSAAGSLAAYLLGITSLDPLKYGLLFERFLNPERISLPDVDIDFCFERRSAVIDYIINKYGVDHVAQIVTFGTMMARAAIRDVGRVMDIPYSEVDQVAKLIPAEFHITIEKALRESTELNELYQQDERVKQLIDTAVMLEGMPRHASTHAAGIVITPEPLTNYLPLYKSTDGPLTTQFTKDQVEELGLLKIDLLGLRTLTVISDTIRLIGEGDGPGINIDQIPLDDPKTFVLLSQGESIGVFQLESSGMRTLLKDLRPQHFEDLVALVALYRPGPLGSGMVEDFIKRKHGEKKVVYLHPKLETILNDTYGIILYQEQVMRIASELAGFTLSEADLLRRAMGKKKPEIIAGLRAQFIGGAGKNGLSNSISAQIFDLMEYFAGYGFNKSHSAAYALVAYQTAFLKANYPAEYMAALLTSVKDNTDKIAVYIEECRRLRIEVLPPDINESQKDFAPAQNKIRFGLAAIKNVGLTATEAIIKSRQKEGHFQSYADFCRRLDTRIINKRVLESLIKCGAFDSLGNRRAQLMAAVDIGLGLAQAAQRERSHGQLSLLDFLDGGAQKNLLELPDLAEYPKQELLTMEKESLGLYISGHPLTEYRQSLAEYTTTCLAEVREIKDEVPARNQAGGKDDSSVLSVGGMLTSLKKVNTRRNETMAFGTLEDLTGSLEVVFFPRVYQKYVSFLKTEAIVLVKGRVNTGNEDNKVICEELSSLPKKANASLYLKLENEKRSPHLIAQTQGILRSFPGKSPVYLFFPEEKKMVLTGQDYWVNLSGPVIAELKNLLGSTNVKIKNNET